MCKKDREERVHITDLLETAVFSSVLTDFSEESEHSVKFHDEHQHMDRASGNTECGNTSTAFTIDSESQYLENTTDLLQTAISSSGLTDFFEASEHSIEFHDEDQAGHENIDGASENTECGNTSTEFMADSTGQHLKNITGLLQTAISLNGQTDFSEESEHPIERHEDQAGHEDTDRASENTECENTLSTAVATDSTGHHQKITFGQSTRTVFLKVLLGNPYALQETEGQILPGTLQNTERILSLTSTETRSSMSKQCSRTKQVAAVKWSWRASRDYIKELLESTEDICRQAGSLKEASLQACVVMPPTLSSQYDHEDKDSLIAKRRARFNRKCMWS
ncbi:hypothetical protein MTO96_040019 [Rhipicephalus appendiculatus]